MLPHIPDNQFLKSVDFLFVYSKLLTPKNILYMYYILHNNAHKDIGAWNVHNTDLNTDDRTQQAFGVKQKWVSYSQTSFTVSTTLAKGAVTLAKIHVQ